MLSDNFASLHSRKPLSDFLPDTRPLLHYGEHHHAICDKMEAGRCSEGALPTLQLPAWLHTAIHVKHSIDRTTKVFPGMLPLLKRPSDANVVPIDMFGLITFEAAGKQSSTRPKQAAAAPTKIY
jgi:hypothetical protein